MEIVFNACVSCMKVEDLFSIFETHVYDGIGRIEPFAEMMRETFGVEIDRSSNLNSACCSCILQMKEAALFKKQVLSSIEEIKQLACIKIDYVEDDELIQVQHVNALNNKNDSYNNSDSSKEIIDLDSLNKGNDQVTDETNSSKTISNEQKYTNNKDIIESSKTPNKQLSNVLNQVIIGKRPSEINLVLNTNKKSEKGKEKPKIKVLKQERIVPIIYKNGNIVIDASIVDLPSNCEDLNSISKPFKSLSDKEIDLSEDLVVDADVFENFVQHLDIKSLEFYDKSDISDADDIYSNTDKFSENDSSNIVLNEFDKSSESDSEKNRKDTNFQDNTGHIILDSVVFKKKPVKEIASILNEKCEIEISNQINEIPTQFSKDTNDDTIIASASNATSEIEKGDTEFQKEKQDNENHTLYKVNNDNKHTENIISEDKTHSNEKEMSCLDNEHNTSIESEGINEDDIFEINNSVKNAFVDKNISSQSPNTVISADTACNVETTSYRSEQDRSIIDNEDEISNNESENITEEHCYVINNKKHEDNNYYAENNNETEVSIIENEGNNKEDNSILSESDVNIEYTLAEDNHSDVDTIYDHEYIFDTDCKKEEDEIIPVVNIDGRAHSKEIPRPILATKETVTGEMVEESTFKKQKKSVRFLEDFKIKPPKSYFPMQKVFKLAPDQTKCTICTKSFATRKKLYEHMHQHYPQFKCEKCSKQFVSNKHLKRHMESHLEGPFVCVYCDKLFTKLNTRNSHVWRVHKTATPYNCSKCDQKFPTIDQRLRHMKESHGLTEPKYPCEHCEKKFYDSGSRSKHIRAAHETNRRRFICSECPMKFDVFNALLNHLSTKHGIGEKKFECPACQKKFFNISTLKRHQKLHCESCNEFQCHICGATFSYKAVLKCHIKGHEILDPKQTCYTNININDQILADNDNKYILIVND